MTAPVRPHAATSDCERIRPGIVGQPANTASSLAFLAAALPIVRWSRDAPRPVRRAWRAVAIAVAFEGVGSVAYHGPGGRASKGVHDAGLVLLMAALAGVAATDPRALRPRPLPSGLGAAAVALHTLSRTGGPLCSCDSRVQGHALFHLLAAGALVATAAPRGR